MMGANRHCVYAMARAIEKRDVPIVIFDVPRSGNVSYEALEALKNQIFFCGFGCDYTGMVQVPPLSVLVFSNDYPEEECLSEDRWVIEDLCSVEDSEEKAPGQ